MNIKFFQTIFNGQGLLNSKKVSITQMKDNFESQHLNRFKLTAVLKVFLNRFHHTNQR